MSEKLGRVESRLAELGLSLPDVAKPLAAYTPALAHDGLVRTSGQLPTVAGELSVTGKVGAAVDAGTAKEQARISAINALAAAKSVIGDLDRVTQVVKVVGFVASTPDFTGQPGVIDGASELLGEVFGDIGVHARSAVGVAVLPIDACVEVELVLAYA